MCLTKHHALKTFLTSLLDEGERSASRPGRFTPVKRAPSNHWIEEKVRWALEPVGRGGEDKNSLHLLKVEARSSSP
jgi:hypothetical protein